VQALVTGRRHAEWLAEETMTLYGLLWVAASFCAFLAIGSDRISAAYA